MPTTCDITFGGETLVLGADRTLWWPARRTLFATDLHAGKAEHMRSHGLAIPSGALEADLRRLDMAAERYQTERLIFLGDLFHSDVNSEWETFAAWSRSRGYSVELVRGNHDRFLTDGRLAGAGVTVHTEPYTLAPFTLRHHPNPQPGGDGYDLAGHLHPVIWLHSAARDRLRQPCFWLQDRQLILPAFGSITGGFSVRKVPAEQIYACAFDGSAIVAIK